MNRIQWSPEIEEEVLDWIAGGGSVSAYCAQKGKIARSAVFRHLMKDKAFEAKYATACEARAEALMDETITIADTDRDAQRARNRISSRQYFAEKMKPRRFGAKQTLEHQGGFTLVVQKFSPEVMDGEQPDADPSA